MGINNMKNKIEDLKDLARDARNSANAAENTHRAADAVALSLRLAARDALNTAARKVIDNSANADLSAIDDSINKLNKLYATHKVIIDTAESAHVKSADAYATANACATACATAVFRADNSK